VLTLKELDRRRSERRDRHVVVAFTDMQGRSWERLQRQFFSKDGRSTRRGLQLNCSRSTWRWTRSRLRDRELGARLRRLRHAARPRDAAPDPVARGDGARPLRRALARRTPVQPSPRQVLKRRWSGRGARLHADVRLRARVLPPPRDLRGGLGAAVRGPHALRAVHPRLPHPRHDLRRGLHPPDPQRHARGGIRSRPRRARRGRASTRSTSASPTRSRWPTTT
jgi:hypothetical protein